MKRRLSSCGLDAEFICDSAIICREAICDRNVFSALLLIAYECIPEEFLLSTSENVDCLVMFSTDNIIDRLRS